jgi:hypothetical protein
VIRLPVLVVLLALGLGASAEAAQIPTRTEDAALNALLTREVDNACAEALTVTRSRALVADGRKWGHVSVYCQFGDPPSGAGSLVIEVWAHRATATSKRWTVVGPKYAYRVHPCNELFPYVPERIVRDLRGQCYRKGGGDRPAPYLTLSVFRNALHEYDSVGPWVILRASSASYGFYAPDPEDPAGDSGPPKLADVTREFGTPRRSGCTARWPRIRLRATVCTDDMVTQLVLSAPWQLEPDSETNDRGGPMVRVGDRLSLARYLDVRMRDVPARGTRVLGEMRIGSVDVTTTAVTARGRLTAIQIDFHQVA